MLGFAVLLVVFVWLIAKWRVFQKMGFNGWKSVIPLYNKYLMFKGVYGNGWKVLWVWLPIILMPVLGILTALTFNARRPSASATGILSVVMVAYSIAWIIALIILIKLYIDLAHAFNQTTAFGIGLILVNPVFVILLGFSGYQYQDGAKSIAESDIVSATAYKLENWLCSIRRGNGKDIITQLKELGDLHAEGIIDDSIYEKKKNDLLKRL